MVVIACKIPYPKVIKDHHNNILNKVFNTSERLTIINPSKLKKQAI